MVIRFSSIGDIVLTFPILRSIKTQIPNCELHVVTKKNYSELISASGSVDKVHTLDGSLFELKNRLKKEKIDVVIDLHNNLRSRILCLFLGVRKTYRFRKLNFLKWLIVQFKVNRLPNLHVVDRYFDAVRKIGVINDGRNNQFRIENEIDIRNELNLEEGNFIAIAIGAQYRTKQIPTIKLKEIISKIEFPIVLLGGEMDCEKATELIQMLPEKRIINVCGKYTILQSASILKRARLLVTGDTGLMHIASCFDIPIYVIWGNTIPSFGMSAYRLEGKSNIHDFEVQGLTCRPCSKIGYNQCPKGHFDCIMKQNFDLISDQINQS